MAQIQPPTSNYISQGIHGSFNAVDYAARTSRLIPVMNSKSIYAIEDGTITAYGASGTMGNRLELTSADKKRRWGMGHLESTHLKVGAVVKRGQLIGIMGHTGFTIPKGYYGTHLHLVCLTGGKYVYPPTIMNTPFSVYVPPQPLKMPPIGSRIRHTDSRTGFEPGTNKVRGTLPPDTRIVRGYDNNRILVNSASIGNNTAMALFYTNGVRIPGWKQI